MNSPHCLVAGTLVCTVDGEVPIEDIEVGDYVLSENAETGEIDYKPVLETYEHDTYDVVYLTIDGEEFITTEGHPFYTLERGFVKAGELRYSDTLVDDNGKELHLEKKNKEHLTKPVTVYNFAVEDYHTYFVGENEVLVHNTCAVSEKPLQTHHFATNKSKKYTPKFNKIAKKYGLNLDGNWNKAMMPHQGRHTYAYHDYVLKNMEKIDSIARGDVKMFKSLYKVFTDSITPEMLYKGYKF